MAQDFTEEEKFCMDIINFSFWHFGLKDNFGKCSHVFDHYMGRAVVCLQVELRDYLRRCFLASIGMLTNVMQRETVFLLLERLMNFRYLEKNLFAFMLSNLATLLELNLFLHTLHLGFPDYWFSQVWASIFVHRMSQRFHDEGGWPRLTDEAKEGYGKEEYYNHVCVNILSNLNHPYGEIRPRTLHLDNILKDFNPKAALLRRTSDMKSTELSICLINSIYRPILPNYDDLITSAVRQNLAVKIEQDKNIGVQLYDPPEINERLV